MSQIENKDKRVPEKVTEAISSLIEQLEALGVQFYFRKNVLVILRQADQSLEQLKSEIKGLLNTSHEIIKDSDTLSINLKEYVQEICHLESNHQMTLFRRKVEREWNGLKNLFDLEEGSQEKNSKISLTPKL